MNKLVRVSLTGGAESRTDAICIQEAIETASLAAQERPCSRLFDQTLVTDEVAGVVYLLKDKQGHVIECRGDLDFMQHPIIAKQIEHLIASGSLTWQPFVNIIDIIGTRVSARKREPIPPS